VLAPSVPGVCSLDPGRAQMWLETSLSPFYSFSSRAFFSVFGLGFDFFPSRCVPDLFSA